MKLNMWSSGKEVLKQDLLQGQVITVLADIWGSFFKMYITSLLKMFSCHRSFNKYT